MMVDGQPCHVLADGELDERDFEALRAIARAGRMHMEKIMADRPFAGELNLGTFLVKTLIEEIRSIRVPWSILPQGEQQPVIDRITERVDAAVKKGMGDALAGGFPRVVAKLESITIKDATVAKLTFGNEELHALADFVGTDVVLVLASPDNHQAGVGSVRADADQPSLPMDE